MNFGLYLVKVGVINEETYLNALEEQYSSLPSMIEVLRKKCNVCDSKILEIVKIQNETNSSFLEAARKIIDDQLLQEAIEIQNKSIKTIGEILIDNNLVDLVNIQEQVEAYVNAGDEINLDSSISESDQAFEKDQSSAATSNEAEDTEVSQAAIDSMKEIFGADSPEVKEMEAQLAAKNSNSPRSALSNTSRESFFKAEHQLNQDSLPELIAKFNAREIVEISKSIKELADTTDNKMIFDNLNQRFEIILNAAKLSGAKILEESIKTLKSFIEGLTDTELDENIIDSVHQFFSLLVKLRNHIEQEKSEKGFFEESDRLNLYESLIASF